VAKESITRLIDDLDGGVAHETVRFALDGRLYEIDLSSRNASKLRKELAPYVESGVRVSSGTGGGARRRGGATAADRQEIQAIREWAERKGLPVASRGRIRQDIVDQYHRRRGR
jgi:Lsr2